MRLCIQVSSKNLFETLDRHMAGSRVSFDADMKMMPEDAFIKHATEVVTEGEGKLTRPQAAAQWWLVCVYLCVCMCVVCR